MIRLVSSQRQVKIEPDTKRAFAKVNFPENRLRQILYNLLQNAIEASPDGGLVRVTAVIDQQQLTIAVSDQGQGIQAEVRSHIFEPFYTTKDGSTSGGMGLGLSVCKSLVEAMNGSIDFESNPGKGTEFRIVLPLGENGF
jgi:signal transduction histidine kinase